MFARTHQENSRLKMIAFDNSKFTFGFSISEGMPGTFHYLLLGDII